MWHLKPQKFIADDQMLLEKGFADELHLKPVYPMLKSGDIKANKNLGGITHPSKGSLMNFMPTFGLGG